MKNKRRNTRQSNVIQEHSGQTHSA